MDRIGRMIFYLLNLFQISDAVIADVRGVEDQVGYADSISKQTYADKAYELFVDKVS